MNAMDPMLSGYFSAEFGTALVVMLLSVVYLAGLRLLLWFKRDDDQSEREADYLAQFSPGSLDNQAGGTPHPVGNTSHPPSMHRSSGAATPHADAFLEARVERACGYMPAALSADTDTLTPANRFSSGCGASSWT